METAASLMGTLSRIVALVAALAIAGPAMAQTTDRPDAQQTYQGLALGSIPSSATVRDLGDGTKIYDFTNDDGTQVRCALYDVAGDASLMSCEKEP